MNTKLVSSQKDISDYFPKSIMLKTTKTEKFVIGSCFEYSFIKKFKIFI